MCVCFNLFPDFNCNISFNSPFLKIVNEQACDVYQNFCNLDTISISFMQKTVASWKPILERMRFMLGLFMGWHKFLILTLNSIFFLNLMH